MYIGNTHLRINLSVIISTSVMLMDLAASPVMMKKVTLSYEIALSDNKHTDAFKVDQKKKVEHCWYETQ